MPLKTRNRILLLFAVVLGWAGLKGLQIKIEAGTAGQKSIFELNAGEGGGHSGRAKSLRPTVPKKFS